MEATQEEEKLPWVKASPVRFPVEKMVIISLVGKKGQSVLSVPEAVISPSVTL